MKYEMLLSPFMIGDIKLRNRTVMTAAEMSLGQTDGKPTEKMIAYYEERAKGGTALIIPGICRVNDTGAPSTFTQLSMSHDYHIKPMQEFADRIHAQGAKFCIQLHHPGRQGYASSMNVLPLVIPMVRMFPKLPDLMFKCTPLLLGLEEKKLCQSVQAPSKCELSAHGATRVHAMSRGEIKRLVRDFVKAARRCQKAGVDMVELHAGHGYLLQQFISPNTNQRTDEYGGSFKNRMRFIAEIIRGIQSVCGKDYPIIVRMTADECYDRIGQPGKGYDLSYGKKIAKFLERLGVSALNVTSGCYDTYNYWLEPASFEPGWRAYMAKAIKETVQIPVIAANFMRSPDQAEQQLQDGVQDLIGSARTFICDPQWVRKVEAGHPDEIRRCIGCLHCIASLMTNAKTGKQAQCALNPAVGAEQADREIELKNDGAGKRAVVVGGGPAGLMAAQTLLRRGFEVTVFEKEEICGGQVVTASECHLKKKLYWCIEDLIVAVKNKGGTILTGTEADEETILALEPTVVVLATGAEPVVPRSIAGLTEGTERGQVVTAPSIIHGDRRITGQEVVVAGSGLTGLAAAEILAQSGNRVTIIEMADSIAPGAWFQIVDDELSRLLPAGVTIKTGKQLTRVEEGSICCKDVKTGKEETYPAESLVLSLGVRGTSDLYQKLEGKVENLVQVGDASKSGTIAHAVHCAYQKTISGLI